MIKFILILLIILAGIYAYIYISAFIKNRNNLNKNSWWKFILIGLVTDIGDTIGIGNFAPTASIFKIGNLRGQAYTRHNECSPLSARSN